MWCLEFGVLSYTNVATFRRADKMGESCVAAASGSMHDRERPVIACDGGDETPDGHLALLCPRRELMSPAIVQLPRDRAAARPRRAFGPGDQTLPGRVDGERRKPA